mgnify:FL=1
MTIMKDLMRFSAAGEIAVKGYPGEMIKYTIDKQFSDDDLWKVTVNQFRTEPDGADNGWRGEFWGKLMRAASLTYRATGNAKLYAEITKSVKDMLTAQDKSGRFSTYAKDCEFRGWDMWSRKYAMLGFLYYIDVCKNKTLVAKITKALKRHADYIIKRVGDGKRQTGICDTTDIYGGMNSCSILEPFVKLYELTGEKRYLDFAEYIVSVGFSKDQNVIKLCLTKEKYPFEFNHTKAYEMMSCFEGLLEYYKVTGKEDALKAVINFVDMTLESDYTVIGSCGCTHELFDNSSVKQTEYSDGVMQETCVTVTLIKLCARLLTVTGDAKYADVIERSGYNALFGAVNSENQTMKRAKGIVWKGKEAIAVSHESFPFDSYSPLRLGQRARKIGGFRVMENGRSYGCCAAIGGAGTAIFGLAAVTKGEDGYFINLYADAAFTDKSRGTKITVKADMYKKGEAKIAVVGAESAKLRLRIPDWTKKFTVAVNGANADFVVDKGYAVVTVKGGDKIIARMPMRTRGRVLNGKVEFERGPIVLARDDRFGEDVKAPVKTAAKSGGAVAKLVKNTAFYTNETVKVKTKDGEITLCDYSSAGKNYDDENCNVSVWSEIV